MLCYRFFFSSILTSFSTFLFTYYTIQTLSLLLVNLLCLILVDSSLYSGYTSLELVFCSMMLPRSCILVSSGGRRVGEIAGVGLTEGGLETEHEEYSATASTFSVPDCVSRLLSPPSLGLLPLLSLEGLGASGPSNSWELAVKGPLCIRSARGWPVGLR
ncbi:hypothetical protein VTI28DRAFT_6159 [Corynascus sepedonium]